MVDMFFVLLFSSHQSPHNTLSANKFIDRAETKTSSALAAPYSQTLTNGQTPEPPAAGGAHRSARTRYRIGLNSCLFTRGGIFSFSFVMRYVSGQLLFDDPRVNAFKNSKDALEHHFL